jgi:hypothetical protein
MGNSDQRHPAPKKKPPVLTHLSFFEPRLSETRSVLRGVNLVSRDWKDKALKNELMESDNDCACE